MFSTNSIIDHKNTIFSSKLFDKTKEPTIVLKKVLDVKNIKVNSVKGISFIKNSRSFKLFLKKANIKESSNKLNTFIPQSSIGNFENISDYIRYGFSPILEDSEEAKYTFAHSFCNFSTLYFILKNPVYTKNFFKNSIGFTNTKEVSSIESIYLKIALLNSTYQITKKIQIKQFHLKTMERNFPFNNSYKIACLNQINLPFSKYGFSFIDAFNFIRQLSRIKANSNNFVFGYSFRAPRRQIKFKSNSFKEITSRYTATNPRKLTFNKQKRIVRWKRFFIPFWKPIKKSKRGNRKKRVLIYPKGYRFFSTGRKLFTLLSQIRKNTKFKAHNSKRISKIKFNNIFKAFSANTEKNKKIKKVIWSGNSSFVRTGSVKGYSISSTSLISNKTNDSLGSEISSFYEEISSAKDITSVFHDQSQARSPYSLPFIHENYNRKNREKLLSILRGSTTSLHRINAFSFTRYTFELTKKVQAEKREKLRKEDKEDKEIVKKENEKAFIYTPFSFFTNQGKKKEIKSLQTITAKQHVFNKRKKEKNSISFLRALNKERGRRYRYIGIYIPDLIRIAFIALYGKHAQLLISFFAFLLPKLPRNRKETKFIRFLIKVAKVFAAQRPEITGLRLTFQGRINRWRRTKQIKAQKGTLPLHTIDSLDIRISYGRAQSINRKGAFGRRFWIVYNSFFVKEYTKYLFKYIRRIKSLINFFYNEPS